MADSAQMNDAGTKIRLNCVEDVSTATVRKIKYTKPDGTKGEWTAFKEAGTNYLYYITLAGDLDQPLYWNLQTYIESPAWTGHGENYCLKVEENLAA